MIDPLDSLRPGGPNGRTEGNVFVGTEHEDAQVDRRRHREVDAGQVPDERRSRRQRWSIGDIEKGFKEADLVIERDHHSRRRRTSRSRAGRRWPTGRTASSICTARRRASRARSPRSPAGSAIKQDELVIDQRVHAAAASAARFPARRRMAIPALLSKKLNGRPVMMRISREEETYIGRTRPGFQAGSRWASRRTAASPRSTPSSSKPAGPTAARATTSTSANLASLLLPGAERALPRDLGGAPTRRRRPRSARRAGCRAGVMFEPMISEGRAQARHRSGRDPQDERDRQGRRSSACCRRSRRRAGAGQPAATEGDELPSSRKRSTRAPSSSTGKSARSAAASAWATR